MKPFVEFPDKSSGDVNFTRPKYLRFKEGSPVLVRILDESAHSVEKHWIQKANASLLCIGELCPLCLHNDELRREFPDSYKKSKGFYNRSRRYLVNILDRTPVIKDPETGEEYYAVKGKFPTTTSDGERCLVGIDPEPSNTIKILERGRELFEQLAMIHSETVDLSIDPTTGNEVVKGGITSFDIKLSTKGAGKDMTIMAMPMTQFNDDVTSIIEKNNLDRYVLSSVGMQLTADEMIDVTKGVSITDIFAKRKAEAETEVAEEVQGSLADVSDRVKAIFGDDIEGVEGAETEE